MMGEIPPSGKMYLSDFQGSLNSEQYMQSFYQSNYEDPERTSFYGLA